MLTERRHGPAGHVPRPTQHLTATFARRLSVVQRDDAIDDDVTDAFGQERWFLVGGAIDHSCRIEDVMSATIAKAIAPRSIIPIVTAGSSVILRTASCHVSAFDSRTYRPSTRGYVP